MTKSKIAPFTISKQQREWLEKKKEETGNSYTVILRNLIQDQIKRDKKDEK